MKFLSEIKRKKKIKRTKAKQKQALKGNMGPMEGKGERFVVTCLSEFRTKQNWA